MCLAMAKGRLGRQPSYWTEKQGSFWKGVKGEKDSPCQGLGQTLLGTPSPPEVPSPSCSSVKSKETPGTFCPPSSMPHLLLCAGTGHGDSLHSQISSLLILVAL
ncbi:hypothetical protein E2320_007261 [Naja naja]|nr:hypothetical protein E2320_007261 [Naja naja]